MSGNLPDRNLALIVLMVVGFIIYGSLYPFAFHSAPPGALHALLASWSRPPERGDLLANVLLYMPLGYFGFLALPAARPRFIVIVLAGLCLSVAMELTQYYDTGRDTELSDVFTNVAGTALGAVLALGLGDVWRRFPRQRLGDPAALLLLAAWTGYNLFPFVPVIDLHKYWSAVKPLLLHPSLSPYALFTHAAAWFAAAVLLDEIAQGRRTVLLFAAFITVLLGGQILVVGGVLTPPEIAGAAVALGLLFALMALPRARLMLATLLLAAAVIAGRLEPFHFTAAPGPFGWIPFLGFMHGSIGIDTLAFLEKAFLYGSLIWLLNRLGWALRPASFAVATVLLATSIAERYIPGRSAEITDAVMALFAGAVIALVRPPARQPV